MRDDLQESPSPASEEWVGWCCSYCGAPLTPRGSGLFCRAEERWFATRDGVHLLLPEERRRVLGAFRDMRERAERALGRDMREVMSSDHCFREVLGRMEAGIGRGGRYGPASTKARTGWSRPACVVAVVDPRDGNAETPTLLGLPRAEAELDALPLEPGRFDLVVAAASLHSSPSLPRALVELGA